MLNGHTVRFRAELVVDGGQTSESEVQPKWPRTPQSLTQKKSETPREMSELFRQFTIYQFLGL